VFSRNPSSQLTLHARTASPFAPCFPLPWRLLQTHTAQTVSDYLRWPSFPSPACLIYPPRACSSSPCEMFCVHLPPDGSPCPRAFFFPKGVSLCGRSTVWIEPRIPPRNLPCCSTPCPVADSTSFTVQFTRVSPASLEECDVFFTCLRHASSLFPSRSRQKEEYRLTFSLRFPGPPLT